jgi:hypothetical protein
MKKKMLIIILTLGILNISTKFVHATVDQKAYLMNIVNELKPPNSLLVSPEKPFSTQSIQEYDFDQDGQKELIITFEVKEKEQPAPCLFGAMVLKKGKKGWEEVWETKNRGVGLYFSGLADITGDGTKEYLFGWTIGASAGNKLEIFKWNNLSLTKLAEVDNHKIDLINENQKVSLAIWQRYLADAYFVDVLKWNGEKLVDDDKSFLKYYPVIEKFYSDKITNMDAWFYWYCLADAQIKAKLFNEASKSIQKGTILANELSMPDVVDDFNKVSERLERK